MVKKAGKYGISSGNTFKVPTCRYLRRYAKTCFIIRHTIRQDSDEELDLGLDDLDLSCDGVPFSLNKKGRWLLPNLIREEILDGDYEEFGIQLVERHDITKTSNCVSLCSKSDYVTKRKLRKVKERSYFCKNSVTEWERKARLRLGLPVTEVKDEVFDEPSQVIYDVSYPVPDTCSLVRDSKSIAFQSNFLYKQDVEADEHPRPAHRRRRSKQWKRVSKDLVKEVLEGLNDATVESVEEVFSSNSKNTHTFGKPTQVSLSDLIDVAVIQRNSKKSKRKEKKNDLCLRYNTRSKTKDAINQNKHSIPVVTFSSESNLVDSSSTKAKRIVVPKDDPTSDTHKTTGASNISSREASTLQDTKREFRSIIFEPVIVRLPFWEITPSILKRRFCDKYMECECHPRKFLLDISDNVSSLEKYKRQGDEVNAFLVILVDTENERSTATDCVCKVVLNTKYDYNVGKTRIDTVSDYMDTNVGELINNTLLFANSLPDGSIQPNAKISPCSIAKDKRHIVGDAENIVKSYDSVDNDRMAHERRTPISANVEDIRENRRSTFGSHSNVERMATTSRTVDESFLLKYFTSLTNDYSAANVCSDVSVKCTCCGICSNPLEDKISTTALLACGHWFCNKCWGEYLNTTIRNRSATLPCPEFECEAEVDSGTAISLVALPTIIQHALCRYETERNRSEDSNLRPMSSRSKMLPALPTHARLVKSLVVSGIQCSQMGDGLEVRGVSLKSARSTRSGGKSRLVMSECRGDETKPKVTLPKRPLRHRWQYIRATTVGDLAKDYHSFAQNTDNPAESARLGNNHVGVQGTRIVKPQHVSTINEARFNVHYQGLSKSHTVVSARHFKRLNNGTINDKLRKNNLKQQSNDYQNSKILTDNKDDRHVHEHSEKLSQVPDGIHENINNSGLSNIQGARRSARPTHMTGARQTYKTNDMQADSENEQQQGSRQSGRESGKTSGRKRHYPISVKYIDI